MPASPTFTSKPGAAKARSPAVRAAPAQKGHAAASPRRSASASALPAFARQGLTAELGGTHTTHPAAGGPASRPQDADLQTRSSFHSGATSAALEDTPRSRDAQTVDAQTVKDLAHRNGRSAAGEGGNNIPAQSFAGKRGSPIRPLPALAAPKLAPIIPSGTARPGGGQPLPAHIRDAIQNSLHFDLSPIRIHTGTTAQAKVQLLKARAFTFGLDIFLGPGEQPTDLSLLSHEAAHVLQQQTRPRVQAKSSVPGNTLENEADQAASAVQNNQEFAVKGRVSSLKGQQNGGAGAAHPNSGKGGAPGPAAKPGKEVAAAIHRPKRKGEVAGAEKEDSGQPPEKEEKQLSDHEAIAQIHANWSTLPLQIAPANLLVVPFDVPPALDLHLKPAPAGTQKPGSQADENQVVRDAVSEYGSFNRQAGDEHSKVVERSNQLRREIVSAGQDAIEHADHILNGALGDGISALSLNRSVIDSASVNALKALDLGESVAHLQLGGASAAAHKQIDVVKAKTEKTIAKIEADLRADFDKLYGDNASAIEVSGKKAVEQLGSPELHAKARQGMGEKTDPIAAAEMEAEYASVPRYLTELGEGARPGEGFKGVYESRAQSLRDRITAKPKNGDSLLDVIKKFVETLRTTAIGDGTEKAHANGAAPAPQKSGADQPAGAAKGASSKNSGESLYTQANHQVDHAYAQAIASLRSQVAAARKSIHAARKSAQEQCAAQRDAFFAQLTNLRQAHVANVQHATASALKTVEDGARSAISLYPESSRSVAASLEDAARKGSIELTNMTRNGVLGARQSMALARATQTKRLEQVSEEARGVLAQQGKQAGDASSGIEQGFSQVASQIARSAATNVSGLSSRQVQGFKGLSAGIAAAAAQFTKSLDKLFEQSVQKAKKDNFDKILASEKTDVEAGTKDVQQKFQAPLDNPREAIQPRLDGVAKTIADALKDRAARARKAWGIIFLDQNGLLDSLRGLTAKQGAAVEREFKDQFQKDLRFKLEFEYHQWPGGLSKNEYNACISYLNGDTSKGALYELKTAKGWFSSDSEKAERVMRSLTPDERDQTVLSPEWGEVSSGVRDGLSGADLQTFDALAIGNVAQADAIRLRENVKKAKEDNDKDALLKALKNYHTGSETNPLTIVRADIEANQQPAPSAQGPSAGAAQAPADRKSAIGRTDKEVTFADVQREFAQLQAPSTPAVGDGAKQEDPATVLAKYVLAPVQVEVPDGDGGSTTVTYTVEGPDAVAAEALARFGPGTTEAKAALLYRQTETEGKTPDFEDLEDVAIDPRLNPSLPQGRGLNKDQRDEIRKEQDQLYVAYAKLLKDNNLIAQGVADPAQARMIAADRLKGHFDKEDEKEQIGAQFAASLVTQDVPDNVAALRYAQLGAGTDEEMIHRAFQRMSRAEVDQARTEYQLRYKSDLFADLGLYGKGTFGELSGDDRLQAEREAMGVPQNDREAAEVALFTNMQQKSETGIIGRALVGGGEEAALDRNKERLLEMAGGAVTPDDFGRPQIVGSTNFDDKGKYQGGDYRAFDRELTNARITAENYAASVDRVATAVTTAIAIIGAVAATVLTLGAGAPILVAVLVAGGAGLAGMGASYAIKGGRYGWEQALTDLGMTGVQMLTAGIGASLGAAAKVGEAAAEVTEAAEVAEVAAEKTAETAAKAQSLGQVLKTGAITGGVGGAGGAALDERTWKDGIGTGFGRVLLGGARGAFSGTVTAGVTHGLEQIPLGGSALGTLLHNNSVEGAGMLEGGMRMLGGGLGRGLLSSAGAVAGRAGELGFDEATGQFHGNMRDALSSLEEAGGQSLLQGFFEGAGHTAAQSKQHGQPGRPEHAGPASMTEPHEPPPGLTHPPAEEPQRPAVPEHEPVPAHFTPEKTAGAPSLPAGEGHAPLLPEAEPAIPLRESIATGGGAGGEGGMPPSGGAPPPSGEEPLFPHITDAEIDALFEPATSGPMVQVGGQKALDESLGLRLPAAQGGEYWGVDPANGMTVQEYRFLSQRGLPAVDSQGNPILGPRGNKMTKMRIHSPDPTAPAGSASRRGWTMNFEQGENLRMTAGGTWFDKRFGTLPDGSQLDVRPFRRGPAGEWVESGTGRAVANPDHLAALDDWDHKMASSHIPLFPEPGARPAPPSSSVPPEQPPAPRIGPPIPSEAAEPGLDDTRALSISDQAAAGITDSWFAGDAAEKYKLPPAESPDSAIRRLISNRGVASPFADYVEEDGRISHVDLETKSIDPETGKPAKVKVRFEMVDSLPRENGIMPVAMYEPAGPNEYIVRISKGAPAISLKRGIAHELVEIRANHGATEVPQEHALAPASKATRLSPHDEGRLAEMRVLAEDIKAATGEDREALLNEAQKLAAHLGLIGKTPEATARRALAYGHLGQEPGAKWLKIAISFSEENPFRQRIHGDLREDLDILARRVELAREFGDLSENREYWLKSSRSPIVRDAVEIMRQALLRDEFFMFKGSGFGSPKQAMREDLLKRIGPPGSVERFLFDQAFDEARKPRVERPPVVDPSSIDPSTSRAAFAAFGDNEKFKDWGTFVDSYAKLNPSVSEPDPSSHDPNRRRIPDQLRLRALFDQWASGSYVEGETGRVRSVFSEELEITPGYEARPAKNPAEVLAFQLAKEISIRSHPETLPAEEAAAIRFKHLQDAADLSDVIDKTEKAGDVAKAKTLRTEFNDLLQSARQISEDFGVAAGRAFAAENFPAADIVESQGARVFDLVLKTGDDFVLVECKGGGSGLGKRMNRDGTKVVQQGTREYALAVAKDMSEPGKPAAQREIGRKLYDKLMADPDYKPKYFVVRQSFDSQGRPTVPTVGQFEMSEIEQGPK